MVEENGVLGMHLIQESPYESQYHGKYTSSAITNVSPQRELH